MKTIYYFEQNKANKIKRAKTENNVQYDIL